MENNELFQIGEVSRLFHISVSILRHYEKIGLVQPEYKDPETGYRYYSARQFECLNTIRYLRALDMPLEEITKFVKNRNIEQIQSMLLRQKEQVLLRQQELLLIQRKIEKRFNPYEIVFIILDDEDHFKGKTLALPEETCVTVKFQGSHENAAKYYEMLMQYIEKQKLSICGFSKEITMIDYGITDDVSRFVTEIQIPVSGNPD